MPAAPPTPPEAAAPPDPTRPGAEAALVAARAEAWRARFAPRDEFDDWLVGQVAAASVRIDVTARRGTALRLREARRAAASWDDDRRLDAEDRAARLEKDPARVARRLAATAAGCLWLVARWEALLQSLAAAGTWDESERSRALDLLGVPKAERVGGSPLDPAPGQDPAAALAALARGEIDRLRRRRAAGLDEIDRLDRAAAEAGLPLCPSPAERAVRRDEAEAVRWLRWAVGRLDANSPGAPGAGPRSIGPTRDEAGTAPEGPPSGPGRRRPGDRPSETPRPGVSMSERNPAAAAAVPATPAPPSGSFPPSAGRTPPPPTPPLGRRARRALLKQQARRARGKVLSAEC